MKIGEWKAERSGWRRANASAALPGGGVLVGIGWRRAELGILSGGLWSGTRHEHDYRRLGGAHVSTFEFSIYLLLVSYRVVFVRRRKVTEPGPLRAASLSVEEASKILGADVAASYRSDED